MVSQLHTGRSIANFHRLIYTTPIRPSLQETELCGILQPGLDSRRPPKRRGFLEIEAKYSIPDEQTFRRLQETPTLAGFDLGPATTLDLHDTYLDTPDRAILAGGYACRLRQEGSRHLATLKGLGGATGSVHRRDEFETELPGPLLPHDWPPGAARDLALRLAGDQPPTLEQRDLLDAFARQATLVLDRLRLGAEAEQARVVAESERLSKSLLNSVSHELRTPIAPITTAVSALETLATRKGCDG